MNDDSLWLFGTNHYGELGLGYSGESNPNFIQIIGTKTVSGVIKPAPLNRTGTSETDCGGFTVESVEIGTKVNTDANGYFEMSLPGDITRDAFKITKNGYLKRTVDKVCLSANVELSSSESPIQLLQGDFIINGSQDGSVNIADIMNVAMSFNKAKGQDSYAPECDLNSDGAVNIVDIMIVAGNFVKCSWEYPSVFSNTISGINNTVI